MAESAAQAQRDLALTTPLGEDVLLLRRMTYEDALGRMFEMHLDLLSSRGDIDFDEIVGKPVSVRLSPPGHASRYLNGYVSQFVQTDGSGAYSRYAATVVPWLWFLTLGSDARVFHNQTVPEIVKSVFREEATADFEDRLLEEHPAREYCVQYHETNFQFVSRLMEEEGIYYAFVHRDDGRQVMVLTDSAAGHEPVSGYEQVAHRDSRERAAANEPLVWSWTRHRQARPGRVALKSFDFVAPKQDLEAKATALDEERLSEREMFHHTGKHLDYGTGERHARLRLEEWHARQTQTTAVTNAPGLIAGATFRLTEHPRTDLVGEYRVFATRFRYASNAFETVPAAEKARDAWVRAQPPLLDSAFAGCRAHGLNLPDEPLLDWPSQSYEPEAATDEWPWEEHAEGMPFVGEVVVMPVQVTFRPRQCTPKPVISGPHTAVVGGTPGEVVSPDEYGRVKVHFHWDRYPAEDRHSSCYVRVSQQWAGKNYGTMFLPHGGQEVIVEFLEGDPDRPIITGRVYNRDNMPPLPLPERKHETVVARDQYGNEIILDATPGDEHIRIYSPHHESGMVLGRSIWNATRSNKAEFNLGSTHLTQVGARHDLVGGYYAAEVLGVKSDVVVGSSWSGVAGSKLEFNAAAAFGFNAGASYQWNIGTHVESYESKKHSFANGVNAVASKAKAVLVSNPGTGTQTPTALVKATPAGLTLAHAPALDGVADTTTPGTLLAVANLAALVAGAAAGGTAYLGTHTASNWSNAKTKQKKEERAGLVAASAALGVTALAGFGMAAGAAILMGRQKEATATTEVDISRGSAVNVDTSGVMLSQGPDAFLKVNKLSIGGSSKNIFLSCTDNASLTALKKIDLVAGASTVTVTPTNILLG